MSKTMQKTNLPFHNPSHGVWVRIIYLKICLKLHEMSGEKNRKHILADPPHCTGIIKREFAKPWSVCEVPLQRGMREASCGFMKCLYK